MNRYRTINFILFGSLLVIGALLASQVLAQVDVGISPEIQAAPDVRVVVARIVRAFLGVLGVIGVLIVLYGGFVWMTAGGNAEKVTKAKQILLSGGIGLAIILSAFGITQFILGRLLEATGVQVVGPPTFVGVPGIPGGALPQDAFTVRQITPQGQVPIRNVQVKILFSKEINRATINGNITVRRADNNADVAGVFGGQNGIVIFTPNANCPAPNEDRKCFDANTKFVVETSTSLLATDTKALTCGLGGGACRVTFTTGSLVDTQPPTARMTIPQNGQSVSVDEIINLEAAVSDDAGIAYISFLVDSVEESRDTPPGDSPRIFTALGDWDTTDLTSGEQHTISAQAFDIDDNQVTSQAITVTVRAAHCFDGIQNEDEAGLDCGGADCGLCDGAACTRNEECASGACFNGQCVAFPTITNMQPADGAPGSFVTIQGNNFGDDVGQIVFLGEPGANDDQQGIFPANCGDVWQDKQVIVEVPPAAVTGPVQLTTAKNFFDRTDNDRGVQEEFIITTTQRPSLCLVDPDQGEFDDAITFSGKNFGAEQDKVEFGGVAGNVTAWVDTAITATVPNVAPELISAAVRVGNQTSNPVAFTVKQSGTVPRINLIEPAQGPPGQYLTLTGTNFGNLVGSVTFTSVATGEEQLADVEFPEQCETNFWKNSSVVVKVPNVDNGGYKIKLAKTSGQVSNDLDFRVTAGQPTPGVCRLNPDNGPIGTQVSLIGENFGNQTGNVRFFEQQPGIIANWESEEAITFVPALAKTGPVQLINSDNTLSNKLNFQVGSCSADSCEEGLECCGDGTCRTAEECVAVAPQCTYSWQFTTGAGPAAADVPRVVVDATCATNTQSPSPFRNTVDACVNALISARFTTNMSDASMTSQNIKVFQCNSGERVDLTTCTDEISGGITFINHNTADEGFLLQPQRDLPADTWYLVTLGTGLRSEAGVAMAEQFQWVFRTRLNPDKCNLDHVQVTPAETTIEQARVNQVYQAVPTAQNCNALDPNDFAWEWASSDLTRATISGSRTALERATALRETEDDRPVLISATAGGQNDSGELTIDFPAPFITKKWPTCGTACVNAALSAQFNIPMNPATLSNQNIKLYSCVDDQCARNALTEVAITPPQWSEAGLSVSFAPVTGLLAPNTRYLVTFFAGITSESGVGLIGLADNINNRRATSWHFGTKEDPSLCAVDRIELIPSEAELFLIGDNKNYASHAFGSPDDCNPQEGQRLNNSSYNWDWSSSVQSVATTSSFDADQNTRIDPLQKATAKGEGTTEVAADAQGKTGSGDLTVICGYAADTQCPAPATVGTYGVGQDSCCHPRPKVTQSRPFANETNVCRNAVVDITFDQVMDINSFPGNIIVEDTVPCPAAQINNSPSKVRSIFNRAGQLMRWLFRTEVNAQAGCPVLGQSRGFNVGEVSKLTFTPTQPLTAGHKYRVTIVGDNDLVDLEIRGVRNRAGVPMNQSHTYTFTAGSEICVIDHVDVNVTPPGVIKVNDLFTCGGRDDCPNDVDDQTAGNQHRYLASAKDVKGQSLSANYSWFKNGDDIYTYSVENQQQTFITTDPTNGEGQLTVFAQGRTQAEGSGARTIAATTFICENPWPTLQTFPYTDIDAPATHFSVFYCRDAGEPGMQDDLPPLRSPVIITPDVPRPDTPFKEFLIPVE